MTLNRDTPLKETLYRESLYRESLHRDSLYRESLYRDSLYRDSLYRGSRTAVARRQRAWYIPGPILATWHQKGAKSGFCAKCWIFAKKVVLSAEMRKFLPKTGNVENGCQNTKKTIGFIMVGAMVPRMAFWVQKGWNSTLFAFLEPKRAKIAHSQKFGFLVQN